MNRQIILSPTHHTLPLLALLLILLLHPSPANGQDYPQVQPNNNPGPYFPQPQQQGRDLVVRRHVEYDPLPQHRQAAQQPHHPFAGFLPGIISLLGSSFLLWWNEGRTAKEEATLRAAESCVIELGDYVINSNDDEIISDKTKQKKGMRCDKNVPTLIHVTGDLNTKSGVTDETFGLHRPNCLFLKRSAESYLWKETKREDRTRRRDDDRYVDVEVTYQYSKIWSKRKINSGMFEGERWGHENPMILPMEPGSTTKVANDVTLLVDNEGKMKGCGSVWDVPSLLLEESFDEKIFHPVQGLGRSEANSVFSPHDDYNSDDQVAAYISENSDKSMVYLPYSAYSGKLTLRLYLSDGPTTTDNAKTKDTTTSSSISRTESGQQQRRNLSIQRNAEMRYPPNIGDTRIFWSEVVAPPEGVSILASIAPSSNVEEEQVDSGHIIKKKSFVPWEYKKTKRSVYELFRGRMTAKEMIGELRVRNDAVGWILRAFGWILNFIGWKLMLSCIPGLIRFIVPFRLGKSFLTYIADIATSVVALVGSISMSALVISIAWLRYRPVWSTGLGLLSALIFYGPWFYNHRYHKLHAEEEMENKINIER